MCTIDGCERKAVAKGMYLMHYKRQWRGNSPDPLNPAPRQPALLPESHPVYAAWTNMKTRCTNPNHESYKYYGGRGIKVCSRWEKFENFYTDMFEGWHSGLSLDRIDVDRDYSPDNCRWVLLEHQARNRHKRGYLDE